MTQQSHEKVAVIAVHGVGQQEPGETARNIADMLGRVDLPNGGTVFDPFTESKLTIPVKHDWKIDSTLSPDVEFSATAIRGVSPSDDLLRYRTISFDSKATSGEHSSKVNVFELYWNDLSHAPSGFAKFLAELYQVYFHLASLGHKAVRFAMEAQHAGSGWLRWIRGCHNMMQLLLPTCIPILNLFLLASVLPIAILAVDHSRHWQVAAALAFIVTAVPLSRSLAHTSIGMAGIVLSVVTGSAASLAVYTLQKYATEFLMIIVLAVGLWMAVIGSRALLARYQPSLAISAPRVALVLTLLLLGYGVPWSTLSADSQWTNALLSSLAFSVYGNFGLLQLAWMLTFLLSLPVIASPLIQRFGVNKGGDRVIRALQTGRIGVLLSANLFFLTTAILWAALLKVSTPIISRFADVSVEAPLGLMYPHLAEVTGTTTLQRFSENLYTLTVGNAANAYLALLSAALIIVSIGILPSAISEGSPPSKPSLDRTRGLASWLNAAFTSFRLVEWLLIAAWLILAAGYALPYAMGGSEWVTSIGVALAASIPALLLGRKLLPKGASQVLDIALDVSNWLKERPMKTNPRGRILVRYLSLLQHIAASGYDRIVLVAHSQGTVVSVDCLRLLQQSPSLRADVFGTSSPSIELVTAGSPLRQLYRERFPHQYGWVVEENDGPDISGLSNVQHWINSYRSGDYVGRTLWSEPVPDKMNPESADDDASIPKTCDLCVGEGAHLHYFDGLSCVVGKTVVKLILRDQRE